MIINVPVFRNSGDETGKEVILDNLVIIDDLFNIVKDKIFYGVQDVTERDDFLYKNLLKYELITDIQTVNLEKNIQLLFYLNQENVKNVRINITNIFDIIKDEFYSVYLLGKESIEFDNLFNKYNIEFTDLTKTDLWYCIIAHVYSTPDITLSGNDTIEYIESMFDQFTNYLDDAYRSIKQEMSDIESNLQNYYKMVKTINMDILNDIKYNTLEVEYRPNDFIKGVKGRFINLPVIFNTLELNINIPFVLLNARINASDNPLSRIYNNTIANSKEIKSWSLNEKVKDTVYTYKRISGLLFKYKIKNNNNYISIIINETGIIKVIWDDIYKNIDIQLDYASILKYMDECVVNVFSVINSLKDVFKSKKKIDNLDNYVKKIKSIDLLVAIPTFIDRFDFSKLLNNRIIIETLFSQKDTISLDILYLYYLKLGSEENRISLSIKDNLYEKGSIIQIYNVKTPIQIQIIIQQLLCIYYTLETRNTTQVFTEKGRIKDLRAAGVDISSIKCQSGQQPLINEEGDIAFNKLKEKVQDIYQVEYKNIRYTCPTEVYPYVGINTNNGICCFKRDQRSKPDFIRVLHPELINVDVQPSNFKIQVTFKDITFTTFAIKVVYSLQNEYKYHFINSNNEIIPILNEQLVEEIERTEMKSPTNSTIWLDTIPIFYLTNNPPKNKCNETPNIYNKDDNNIDKPCEDVENFPFFGYTGNSYPCCFSSSPTTYNGNEKKKKKDIFSKDIITGEKILDNDRFGILHPNLQVLFNKYTKSENPGVFYRYGVNQGKYAILNCIINSGLTVNNSPFDLLIDIKKYITEKPEILFDLNNGYIMDKFTTLNRYMNYLETNNAINPLDIIDVLQRMLDVNIHIFDIPLRITQYKKEFAYDNIKILCKNGITSGYNKNIILIKRNNYYELICHANLPTKKISYIFDNHEKCIGFLNDFIKKTCRTIQLYPVDYKYEKLYTLQNVIKKLENKPWKILAQVMLNNKAIMLMIKKNKQKYFTLLPIFQKGGQSQDLKNYSLQDVINTSIMDLQETINNLEEIQDIFPEYNLMGYTTDSNGFIDSALTSYGIHIPLKKSKQKDNELLPHLNYDYVYLTETGFSQTDLLDEYNKNEKEIYDITFTIKTVIGEYFSKQPIIKQKLLNLILNCKKSKTEKFKIIKEMIQKFIKDYDRHDIIISNITNEILNDNIENNLLNNVIIMSHIDSTKIISRDSESILVSMDDILKWVRNFKN